MPVFQVQSEKGYFTIYGMTNDKIYNMLLTIQLLYLMERRQKDNKN